MGPPRDRRSSSPYACVGYGVEIRKGQNHIIAHGDRRYWITKPKNVRVERGGTLRVERGGTLNIGDSCE